MSTKMAMAVLAKVTKTWRKAASIPKEDIVLVLFFTLALLTVIWAMMHAF